MQINEMINRIIREFDYSHYCEIGYLQGHTFDKIRCENKLAVDPTPQRPNQYMIEHGHNVKVMTSDKFFETHPQYRFDIIFIDGCHKADFVYRDIINGFRILNEGGCLVLHDICPYFESWSRPDQCGDAFRAYMACRTKFENMKMYVVDYFDKIEDQGPPNSDSSGWGIIFQGTQKLWNKPIEYTWKFMNDNRQELMNIKQLDEIIELNKRS